MFASTPSPTVTQMRINMKTKTLPHPLVSTLFFSLLLALAPAAVNLAAEQDTAPAEPVAAEEAAPASVEEPAAETPVAEETPAAAEEVAEDEPGQVVIEYIEADLQSVLRSLASRARINLIMGDEVVGQVTVHLEGVTYEVAMKLIAESKGYAFVKEGDIVKVKTKESLEAEPLELKVFTLNYAKAADVRETLLPTLSARGKVQVDVRSNTLIISDTPSNLVKVAPLIETLDAQTPQVMIEAKFVETNQNPRKDLGIDWTDTLLDHPISAKGSNTDPVTGDNFSGFSQVKNLAGGPWTPATAILNAGEASATFSFINRDENSELLASPRVVTTDNGRARISIATQYPIPKFTFSEQTASLQIDGFEYKDIGIILDVLPRINKNEFVTLEVTPEASSSNENAPLQSGGGSVVEIPVINTRVATTTVLIKSGNTLAIGGLMRTETTDKYTKVPILGDIPVLGGLFRSKSLDKEKRELLIFLTPTIIDPEAQTGYEQYYDGLPDTEAYTDDSWMPADNAKPRKFSFRDDAPAQNTAADSVAGEPVAAEPVAEPVLVAEAAADSSADEPAADPAVNFGPRN